MKPPIPEWEEERLRQLRSLGLLETPSEEEFDRITRLSQRIFGVSYAALNLVGEDRQWGKSVCGLESTETPREDSFCAHAMLEEGVTVVEDAREDERFRENPQVTGPPHIRFYLSYPIYTSDDLPVGTLCVFDSEPREVTNEEKSNIKELAELAQDLVQQKRLEYELRASNKELEEARKEAEEANKAKSNFLAKMSHELRTPLTTILGYQDLLMDQVEAEGLEGSFRGDLEQIRRSAEHLLDLINEILDLSKIAAGKMSVHTEEIEVYEMIEDVAKTIQPLVEENDNELSVTVDDDVGTLYSDRTKIRQCLFNLLSNAAKFTYNGTINLKVQSEGDDEGRRIRFTVTDTGIGIDEEHQEKLFDAFAQVEDSQTREIEGTGLGLAITKRFTEMLGGSVDLESEPGDGTTFTLVFPARLAEETEEPDRLDGPSVSEGELDDRSLVLVIDDDEGATSVVRRYLEPEGYRVEVALDGGEGLRKARELDPDVITLDVMMPEVDGWEVLSELKDDDDTRDIPVVLLTVTENEQMGSSLGAEEFLMKPIDRDRLLHVIQEHGYDGNDGSVMVVEDNPQTRDRLSRILSAEGLTVFEGVNGQDALDKLEDDIHPDLIILDLMMPVMDGTQFLEVLRRNGSEALPEVVSDVPVVVLTNKKLTSAEKQHLSQFVEEIWQKGDHPPEDMIRKIEHQTATRS